jgi:hypothetical protein
MGSMGKRAAKSKETCYLKKMEIEDAYTKKSIYCTMIISEQFRVRTKKKLETYIQYGKQIFLQY